MNFYISCTVYYIDYILKVNKINFTQKEKKNLLCNFENPEKPESPETWETEGPSPRFEVDPEHLTNWPKYDDTVELVESWIEVVGSQGVHTDHHLEYESTQEEQLGVNWK